MLPILPCNLERHCTEMVQQFPEWKDHFLQLAESFSVHFIESKREMQTNIHIAQIRQAKGEDLK